ncbi:MAG: PocR ligand-binding domain-containing protein [bacterium]
MNTPPTQPAAAANVLPRGYVPAFLFRQLAESPEFAEFARLMQQIFGMAIVLNEPDGEAVALGVKGFRGSPICMLIHRSSWATRQRCGACDRRHHARAVATGKPLLYRCHLGFYEMAIPILIQGSHVATLSSGQILPEQQSASAFARLTRRLQPLGIPEPRLRAAYQKAPWLPRARLLHVMYLLEVFARQMCEHALQAHELQAIRDHPAIRRARELVEERFCDVNLTLGDAAKAASISVTHFSRLFQKKAGMSFTRYVQSRRVEEARRLLADTDQSITVICFACGFNSLTHFNRIFRQSEGCSPSQFREQHRQD